MARCLPKAWREREWNAYDDDVAIGALKGRECYAGLDLGAPRDLTALVLVFPGDDGKIDVVPQFFMPEVNIVERSSKDRVPYDVWAKQGFITLIPGATIDPSFVAFAIHEASEKYDLRTVAYDRWRIEDLKRELELFVATLPLELFGQGFKKMSPAVDFLER